MQAGSETTGLQSNFLLYNMAKYPEVQEKLYTEICDTIGPRGKLTEAALARMNYTKAGGIFSKKVCKKNRLVITLQGLSKKAQNQLEFLIC